MSSPSISAMLSADSMADKMSFEMSDIASIFEYTSSHLSAIWTELEISNLILPQRTHRIIGKYLNWEGEVGLLGNYEEVYDAFMTLLAVPPGPWQKGRLAWTYWTPWWMELADLKADQDFFNTYPNCVEVQNIIGKHFKQLVLHEGQLIVKMLEDKVVEAKMVAATMLRMDTALGQDVVNAIAATEKLTKYLKQEGAQ
ncbi:hypothetical protein EV424DRAFT_1351203 [Suillus variegatus]|nr:hypothetical protein EV424DRAFT_1351203 [Suillus variegatus]